MVSAQKPSVIPSLSRDLGTASKEKIQRLSNRSAKMLRLRTSCFAQNDKLGKLLTPNSSLLIISDFICICVFRSKKQHPISQVLLFKSNFAR